MRDTSAKGAPDPLDVGLRRLLDDDRHDAAVAARRQAHWLRQQATEAGTLHGVLLDLCEQGAPLRIHLGGAARTGVVTAVGPDSLTVRTSEGLTAVVATAAITHLRLEPGASAPAGDRAVPDDGGRPLLDVLADAAAARTSVVLRTRDGAVVHGDLTAAGIDVVTLVHPADGATVVAVAAVAEVVLLG